MSLKKNTLWNIVGNVVPLLIGLATMPFLLRNLGAERFGILTILWAIVGYFSLFDFGIGRAITQNVAKLTSTNKRWLIPGIIKSGIVLTFFAGVVGFLVLFFGSSSLSSFLNISIDLKDEARRAFLVAAVAIPFATLTSGLRGVLEGYELFKISNLARISLGIGIFLFPYFSVLLYGPSLVGVSASLVLSRILSFFIYIWFVNKLPDGSIIFARIDIDETKSMLNFGAWMALTNLVSPILVNIDRFFISYTLGASVVAYYTLPFEFLVRYLILPSAIGAALLPKLSKISELKSVEYKTAFERPLYIIGFSMFALCSISALFSYKSLEYYISTEFAEKSYLVAVILCVGVFFNSVAYVPYTAIHARGESRSTGILHSVELVFYIPILVYFVKEFGLIGAAIAWTARTVIDAIVLFFIFHKK